MKEMFLPPDQKRQLGWEGLSLPFPARLYFMPVVRLIGTHPTQNGMFASRWYRPGEKPWYRQDCRTTGFPK